MQVNRLFEIVYLLMEHGCLTAKQLAEKFGVCPRTIYRDIDTLSSAGIPVYANKGKGGGIRLLGEFLLDKTLLTRKEQDEILAALQSLQATHAGESSGVLNRLSSMFARQSEPWIDVDFSHWGADDAQKEIFAILKTGILQRQMVLFVYAGANGETTARSVYPGAPLF